MLYSPSVFYESLQSLTCGRHRVFAEISCTTTCPPRHSLSPMKDTFCLSSSCFQCIYLFYYGVIRRLYIIFRFQNNCFGLKYLAVKYSIQICCFILFYISHMHANTSVPGGTKLDYSSKACLFVVGFFCFIYSLFFLGVVPSRLFLYFHSFENYKQK